jgi:hypothetical protein
MAINGARHGKSDAKDDAQHKHVLEPQHLQYRQALD